MNAFRCKLISGRLALPELLSRRVIPSANIYPARSVAVLSSTESGSLQNCGNFGANSSWLLSSENRSLVISNCRNMCSGEERQVSSFNVQDYDDFKERVLNSDKPVVVDFYADWCGPCKMLGPRLEMVVDNRRGKVMLAKVNIDDCGDVAMDYGVRSVPTVIAFRQGQPVDQFVGIQEEEQIDAFINKVASPVAVGES